MLRGLNTMANTSGFFNEGILNYLFGQQQSGAVEQQHALQPLQQESKQDQQPEEITPEFEQSANIMAQRDAEWEKHKKREDLKFPNRLDKEGNLVNLEEYHAKHKWTRDKFFTNAQSFDWSRQKVKDQPEWLQKELKGTRPFPELPKEKDKDSWGVMEWPEFVRMKDGSTKKVHVGSSFLDIDEKEKTEAWQNRDKLFNFTYDKETLNFKKTDKDKARDQSLKASSKFLYLDVNDKDAWSEYIEEKKDWRGREYNDIKKEYVELFDNAYKFQEKGKSEKHKPAVLYDGLYYENPFYEKGEIFRENIFGW